MISFNHGTQSAGWPSLFASAPLASTSTTVPAPAPPTIDGDDRDWADRNADRDGKQVADRLAHRGASLCPRGVVESRSWVDCLGVLAEAGQGDRPDRQRDDRVEDAPEECGGQQCVVVGAAEFDKHGDHDGVDDAEAAAGDRYHGARPEGDGEGGEGFGGGEFGCGDAGVPQRGEQDEVGEQKVGGDACEPECPACVEDRERAPAQVGGLGGAVLDAIAVELDPDP